MAATTTAIGFVGLGRMGGAMAARFLAAGYPVYGEELHREAAEGLIHEGLEWRDTPRAVAETADVIFSSLPSDEVLESVASGPEGVLAGLASAKTWVEMSTVSPHVSREIAERVRTRGATMLDAPVSGSVPQVESGTLTIMVGGDKGAFERVEPLLRHLGTPEHIGDNGHGLVVKLAINISLAVQMLAFDEGLLLAERSGVDPKRALDVMAESAIGSPMIRARAPIVFDRPDEAWFDMGFMHKDIELALAAAARAGTPLPTASAADDVLHRALELGYEHRDIVEFLAVLEAMASDAATDTTG
jgi:3-hydroxyisobutyrate dehydrogenase-like beta-hydroxyacid dehydrogenase